VTVLSPCDAWAVGFGSSDFLYAVAASSASNAWAVGQFVSNDGTDQNFAIHCC